MLFLGALAVAIVLAVTYLTCGRGFGGGGAGKGEGSGPGKPATAHRCALRGPATGIIADGKPLARGAGVAACPDGADVVVTGDARQGDWDDLKNALDAAKVPYFMKQR